MRPKRNDLCLGHVGPRAVTGAERLTRSGGKRPQAVDGQGDVTRSEGVVWGRLRPPEEAGAQLGAPLAPISEPGHVCASRPASLMRWFFSVGR